MDKEPEERKRFTSASYVKMSALIYVVGVSGALLAARMVPTAERNMMLGVAMTVFIGGGLRILGMLQVHETDRKVGQDLTATKGVEKSLNGGFDKRVKGIVRDVLIEDLPPAISKALDEREKGRVRT